MVECLCINAKNRPKEVPINKWISEGMVYTIIHTGYTIKTREIACTLLETKLGQINGVEIGFKIERFAFTEEGYKQLLELMKACTELNDFDISELLKEKELEIIEK